MKVPAIQDAELLFSDLPDDQKVACKRYEFGRENPSTIKLVNEWRKLQKNERSEAVVRGAMLAQHLGILTLCPEFPDQPWRAIPNAKRIERIKQQRQMDQVQSSGPGTMRPPACQVLNPADHRQRIQALLAQGQAEFKTPVLGGVITVLTDVNMDESVEKIVAEFERWVKATKKQQANEAAETKRRWSDLERQHPELKGKRSSLAHPAPHSDLRKAESELKALGAWRLMRHYQASGLTQERAIAAAIDYTREKKRTPLYSDRANWLKAVKRAQALLRKL